jgi:hypothetical protein
VYGAGWRRRDIANTARKLICAHCSPTRRTQSNCGKDFLAHLSPALQTAINCGANVVTDEGVARQRCNHPLPSFSPPFIPSNHPKTSPKIPLIRPPCLTIRLTQHLVPSALGLVRRWLLIGYSPILRNPLRPRGAHLRQWPRVRGEGGRGDLHAAERQARVHHRRERQHDVACGRYAHISSAAQSLFKKNP